ncbi:hypothetical protein R54767_03370 [Paraburkholderia gardini]|uniref:Uncharacterized protein n=1 Tax=Paraburkholderia gardini TaxID=2823469 RepID=A0ABN7QPP8_9BURK|nr:hypothetical protein R54767_03370 [Paraburkholderia gardini]
MLLFAAFKAWFSPFAVYAFPLVSCYIFARNTYLACQYYSYKYNRRRKGIMALQAMIMPY